MGWTAASLLGRTSDEFSLAAMAAVRTDSLLGAEGIRTAGLIRLKV
jgi:hypothetical protein